MTSQTSRDRFVARSAIHLGTILLLLAATPRAARAQVVEDGSDAVIGKAAAATVLGLVGQRFGALDPKVTALRRAEGAWICGSVNVKNPDGLYLGERGFVVDLSDGFFGRVPDGPELLSPRAAGFEAMERIRQLYFRMCLD